LNFSSDQTNQAYKDIIKILKLDDASLSKAVGNLHTLEEHKYTSSILLDRELLFKNNSNEDYD